MQHLFNVSLLAAALALTASVAEAQQSTGPALTPDEIAVCMCQEQAMERQRDQLDIQGGLLQERQQELNNLDKEIKRQSLSVSSTDLVGQQVLQDLIAQQIALRNLIQLRIRPDYNKQVRDLTQVIDIYNGQCVARPRYTLDVQKAQENLSCPAP